MTFFLSNGERYRLVYHQDCCAYCSIEDICGDLDDIIGSEILSAEEVNSVDEPAKNIDEDSWTWCFYKLDTIKGGVTIRWYGSSNGYYSESATFEKLAQEPLDDFYCHIDKNRDCWQSYVKEN